MAARNNKEIFVKKAISKHGNKFSYDNVVYFNSRIKINIYCNTCNQNFDTLPSSHIRGNGCPFCSGRKVLKEKSFEFLATDNLCKEWHPTKNSISPSEVSAHSSQKIWWKCSKDECGHEWMATPSNRYGNNTGCNKCYCDVYDLGTFIKKANSIHDFKYDYSHFEYVNSITKSKILCKECNSYFDMIPAAHVNSKQGCKKCGYKRNSNNFKKSPQQFIEEANKVHNHKYDYSFIDYKSNMIKVNILCNQCQNIFSQTPAHHLNKHGCPNCANSCTKHGFFFSKKNNCSFKFDSSWEELRMKYYEEQSDIISWSRCEDKINYIDYDLNKVRSYNPDFTLNYSDKIIVEEIKGRLDENARNKFLSAKKYYNKLGVEYKMLTLKKFEFINIEFEVKHG